MQEENIPLTLLPPPLCLQIHMYGTKRASVLRLTIMFYLLAASLVQNISEELYLYTGTCKCLVDPI